MMQDFRRKLGEERYVEAEEDQDALNLSWTLEPKKQHAREGHMQCIVAEPQRRAGEKPLHPHFLVREFQIKPHIPAGGLARLPSATLQSIRVSEQALRDCGDDLTLLKSCALPPLGSEDQEKTGNKGVPGGPGFGKARRRGLTSSTLGDLATSYSARRSAARGGSVVPSQPSRKEAAMALGLLEGSLDVGSEFLRPFSSEINTSSSRCSTASRGGGGMRGVSLVRQSRLTVSSPNLMKVA